MHALAVVGVVLGAALPLAQSATVPTLPDEYHARIEIHDGTRGWQPGWQRADYKRQIFSEARTAIDPLNGKNQTDESINDAAAGVVYTVMRKWNRNHTEVSCTVCPTCTQKPLPQPFLTNPRKRKSGVKCALGPAGCDEWAGTYQGPTPEPVVCSCFGARYSTLGQNHLAIYQRRPRALDRLFEVEQQEQ